MWLKVRCQPATYDISGRNNIAQLTQRLRVQPQERQTTMAQCMSEWQLELFFKKKQDLTDKVLPFLRERNLRRLNITNKVNS